MSLSSARIEHNFESFVRDQAAWQHRAFLGKHIHNKHSCTQIVLHPLIMISHALDATITLIRLAFELILSVGLTLAAIFTFGQVKTINNLTKFSWILTLDSILVLGTDISGIIFGALAYKIDKWVINNITDRLFPESFLFASYHSPYLARVV